MSLTANTPTGTKSIGMHLLQWQQLSDLLFRDWSTPWTPVLIWEVAYKLHTSIGIMKSSAPLAFTPCWVFCSLLMSRWFGIWSLHLRNISKMERIRCRQKKRRTRRKRKKAEKLLLSCVMSMDRSINWSICVQVSFCRTRLVGRVLVLFDGTSPRLTLGNRDHLNGELLRYWILDQLDRLSTSCSKKRDTLQSTARQV